MAFKSKDEFIREYKMYDKTGARSLYLQVLTELEKATLEGNANRLMELNDFIDYMTEVEDQLTLANYYADANNPIGSTNLVILACKHNRVKVLEYLFDSNSRILKNLSISIGRIHILPGDEDEECHSAFYYAIRSGNIELLDTLINKWSGNYFATHSGELDEVLSRAYEDLKLKNILLSEKMEVFVEHNLINLRFFTDTSKEEQNIRYDFLKTRERIELIFQNISLLKRDYWNTEEVNERFLFVVKSIVQNIHILKRQLRSTYRKLPWEEMEFCLISFVSSHLKRQEINLFYLTTLTKRRVLSHLEIFGKKVKEEREIMEGGDISQFADLPMLKREKIVEGIIGNCPQFEALYNDHQKIRDIHSLEKISDYINLALSTEPKGRDGQLIITRVLQVIGEYFKNTLESPKLSNSISELLLLSLPKNTREIIVHLRNSLSHAYSLFTRTEIEENKDINFFVGVQNDIKKVGDVITDILYSKRIKMFRILLQRIINSNSLDEIKGITEVLIAVKLDKVVQGSFKITEHEKLEKLVKELSENIINKTNYEEELFNKINQIINSISNPSGNIRTNYIEELTILKCVGISLSEQETDHNYIRGMKFQAKRALQNTTSKIEPYSLKEITRLSMLIFRSVGSRLQRDNLDNISRLFCEIFFIAEFGADDMRYIEELRRKLSDNGFFTAMDKQKKANNLRGKQYDSQLEQKLTELKNTLSNSSLSGEFIETVSSYKKDKTLQAVVEMLVLDVMSILNNRDNLLENNLLFLDDNAPLLNGKCLRNHLAHDNALVDILLSDPSITIMLNAKKFTEANLFKTKRRIGKLVTDDAFRFKEKHNQRLTTITNQERMFIALEEGNLEILKDCLRKGGDINARSINSWTTLHFAAKGPSLEIVKFILNQNASLNVKDVNGQSPLHVAAAHGRKNIVEFFVKVAGSSVDDTDRSGKTPLHIAAQYGATDTVQVLLENKASTLSHDRGGLSPLHYAIKNNHINVAKMLIAKDENVDINETKGGHTPLHEAAGKGQLELVNFLLQNKADINAKSDRDWTPLHPAVTYGQPEVVETLILKGANVNARVIDGCTPLHYAVENGHGKVVSILLKHGANVNAVDKTYNCTPLHFGARDGHDEIVKILLRNKGDASVKTVEGVTPLHFAVQGGHLETVTTLLEHGVNIHATDKIKATALHHAVEYGYKEVAELLIKNRANVNAESRNNLTPLHLAARHGYQDIADLLLKNKAEIKAKDTEGRTPLHAAAASGNIGVTDLLIQNKALVDARAYNGTTPLLAAALNSHLIVSDLLIKSKADANIADDNGLTPLHAAIVGGQKDLVALLIKAGARVDARDIADHTPLHTAVEAGYKEIVEILVASGANINIKSKTLTPLVSAVKCNHKEIVGVLVANGADVNEERGAPLMVAVFAGHRDIVEVLLRNNADVNIKESDNSTALHAAATRGHEKIVNALISKGAYVDARTVNNTTPLHLAARDGHKEVVEILIENRANINVTNIDGTPLHMAAGHGYESIVKLLLNNGAKIGATDNENRTALELAVTRSHLQIVKILLQHKKMDIDIKCDDDWTMLHIASHEGNIEMVKYLVDEGCDINAKSAAGSKPIHIAAREGRKDTVEFFLSKGLSIDDRGVADQTLLHYAVIKGHSTVVKYLITQGVDVNALDINGVSPMHIAATFGHKDVIEVLLGNGAVYNAVDNLSREPLEMSEDHKVIKLLTSTKNLFDAVKHNNPSEVENHIKAGAFVNATSAVNQTPLHYASWKGYDKVVNILLENKVNSNVVGNNGFTPLHYAAKFAHLKVVKALLSNGAVYNAVSDSGKIPLDLTTDESIRALFQLVSDSFKNIKKGNSKVINDLNKIKDVGTVKAIMGARNRERKTLMVAAIHSNFSKINQLKEILQGDVSLQMSIGIMLLQQGDHKRAASIFESAFEKRQEILGPDNPGTLDIRMLIAKVLYAQGSYQETLDTCEEIFEKQKEMLGLNDKETLLTRSFIALVLHRQGRNEEALKIYQTVYQKQKEILGPDHSDTIDTQFHMALVLDGLEKYEEAININRAVFRKRSKLLGANAPVTVCAQNNIAVVLANQGNYDEALEIYKEVFEKKKMIFGSNHSEPLRTLHNITVILTKQKKYHEALKAQQELLDIQKNVLGPNHLDILNTKYNMGNELFAQGKWISALKIFREVFDRKKASVGLHHPVVLDISTKVEAINRILKLQGISESEIFQHLQKEINCAASNGDIDTVQRLLREGADVNDKDLDGRTPLYYAVNNKRTSMVNILLKAGADVTQITNKGNTPLHTATSKGYKEMVELLLEHVSRAKFNDFINAKTVVGGTTSLHVAAKDGSLEIVKLLLKHGAIHDIKNKESKTPLDLSKDQNVTNLLRLVKELFKDAKSGNVEIIAKLETIKPRDLVAVTNTRNNQGSTLLQVTIAGKHKNITSKLLTILKAQSKP